MSSITIHVAHDRHIPELLTLMRAYCDASDEPHITKPTNDQLLKLCENVLKNPEHEGLYLIARNDQAIGFASLFWIWSYLPSPGRQGFISDLYVSPNARGLGVAGELIKECENQARQRENIHSIVWQTAIDNYSAQKVYQRLGLLSTKCIDYELTL